MLELEHVTAIYDVERQARTVLGPLSLRVAPGSLLVLVGPSGCGKSTLLNLLAGFVPASSGQIRVAGREISGPGSDRGMVFQDDALMPWLDVLGNVALPLRLKGLGRAEREARAHQLLELVGLSDHAHHATWALSGGMRQRVGLARALAADPDVLLMDEPFGALDALTREHMQALLLRVWHASGKTLVLVTHSVEEAVFLATDLVVLSNQPARIVDHLSLAFSREFAQGAGARHIKSLPAFIATRERVLATIFEQDRATS